jgi:uncharacterized membrane protein YraQ (UPF0718 family)
MTFLFSFLFVAGVVALLAGFAQWQRPAAHAEALTEGKANLRGIAPRLPFALVAAVCLGRLLPPELVSGWIGAGSGLPGVLIASALGAALPGGPMLAFPLAIALLRAGAGPEALVALITAWSLIAVNRTLLFELPLLGARFAGWRLLLCTPLPVLAGAIAGGITASGG